MEQLVQEWFAKWESGNYKTLPISDDFSHTSPFGTIEGKSTYLELVEANTDKFLGQKFEIHDALFDVDKACVCYTARQGENFRLDVSEWYYQKGNEIQKIIAYYHIGEIRDKRKLKDA